MAGVGTVADDNDDFGDAGDVEEVDSCGEEKQGLPY